MSGDLMISASRELTAAGISDADLRASYVACRRLNARHGRTYYLSTLLLPAAKRPAVHALYGFARYADDILDAFDGSSVAARQARLDDLEAAVVEGSGRHPVVPAMLDTIERYRIDPLYFHDFLQSMRMDLSITRYPTYDDLAAYMHGSAAVIGLQMLPVLGTLPRMSEVAAPYARDLGIAFQVTNFIRDVGEDLRRGRIYLPLEDLDRHDVSVTDLDAGVADERVRSLLAFEVARARRIFRAAEPGIRLLDPASRDCIRVAFRLYGAILDAVEDGGYRVLDRRAVVGPVRRARVAVPGLARAVRVRRAGSPARC